jgi:hypothetical protein
MTYPRRPCDHCGSLFGFETPSMLKGRRFCSIACASAGRRLRITIFGVDLTIIELAEALGVTRDVVTYRLKRFRGLRP